MTRILACGEDLPSSEAAVDLARRSPIVRAAVGVHPHRASECDARSIARLRELASDRSVVAIGEIGIDLSGRSAPRADQERAFAAQLELAVELALPVAVHVRDSGDVVQAHLDRVGPAHGYVHCYSEDAEHVGGWVARGMLVSFAGTVTFPRSDGLRGAARVVPADRLLLETDAPALPPQPWRGRRNEPAFVAATYACVADVRSMEISSLSRIIAENAAALFGARW